jgi:hypothetical protein
MHSGLTGTPSRHGGCRSRQGLQPGMQLLSHLRTRRAVGQVEEWNTARHFGLQRAALPPALFQIDVCVWIASR